MQMDINWVRSQFSNLQQITPLGTGGFKVVFSAIHPTDGDVVLKLIPHQDQESIRREILAVQKVQSPRVPKILNVGQVTSPTGPCVWLMEQRVNGTTIRACLQSSPLTYNSTLKLGLHVLEALVRAESERIVHRDVKPDNIMVDTYNNYWLLDFGIARHLTLPPLTDPHLPLSPKFTIGYAPLEQCRNIQSAIDARSDLFALGVTLHECLTGINHFRHNARDHFEILRRVEATNLPKLELPSTTGSEFQGLLDSMTQKRPDQRLSLVQDAYDWIREICIKEGI